jgi:P27 family predicted phage terminase small subunit
MGGRRAFPTAVHVLRGNPSRKRLNTSEPKPPDGPVEMPAGLSPGARVVWEGLAPVLLGMRVLTVADVPAFSSLCELQATFAAIIAEKSAPAFRAVQWGEDETGAPIMLAHPLLRLERETAAALRLYYAAFGLEPSARARIVVPPAPEAVSKWA